MAKDKEEEQGGEMVLPWGRSGWRVKQRRSMTGKQSKGREKANSTKEKAHESKSVFPCRRGDCAKGFWEERRE